MMIKVRLKDAISNEFGEPLYQLGLKICHEEERTIAKPKRHIQSSAKASDAQKAHRKHFKEAVAYAQTVMADPKMRAFYESMAKKQNKRPWDLARSDYLNGKNLLPKS
jgi:hypothetical protein